MTWWSPSADGKSLQFDQSAISPTGRILHVDSGVLRFPPNEQVATPSSHAPPEFLGSVASISPNLLGVAFFTKEGGCLLVATFAESTGRVVGSDVDKSRCFNLQPYVNPIQVTHGELIVSINDEFVHDIAAYSATARREWSTSIRDLAQVSFGFPDQVTATPSRVIVAGIGHGSLFGEAGSSGSPYGMFVLSLSTTTGSRLAVARISAQFEYLGKIGTLLPVALAVIDHRIGIVELASNQLWSVKRVPLAAVSTGSE